VSSPHKILSLQINIGRFAQAIPGASSWGITPSQEHHPPLKASNRRSELRGIHKENKWDNIDISWNIFTLSKENSRVNFEKEIRHIGLPFNFPFLGV
jgi:hypothetical protein